MKQRILSPANLPIKKMAKKMSLVLNPTEHVQDLYTENDKMLIEEIKEYCI